MTIPTPTSDLAPPAGLPDVATLTQLASQFFAALPGAAGTGGGGALPANPLPNEPVPAGFSPGPLANGPALPGTFAPGANMLPITPQDAAGAVASAPALVPKSAATNGLPDVAAIVPPALNGRFGGHSLGVPQVTPRSTPGQHAPDTPFYFLGEGVPQYAAGDIPSQDLVTPQSFGLPGEADLRALLAKPALEDEPSGQYYYAPARPAQPEPAAPLPQSGHPAFDVNAVRRDFPILQERVNGRQLVWFDNAATTQKPRQVIDRLSYFYEHENSNIHRAAHELAARATDAYEKARDTVRRFIGAGSADEIIFVRGTTEGINLIAKTWGAKNIGEGDEIIVSHLEHHANIVPWQQLAWEKGAKIKVIPVDDSGQVILEEYQRLITPRTKLVSVTQVSNALGTVVPVKEIVQIAKRYGLCAIVDGAQSVSHMKVDVQDIGADFLVFSGHKIFGPTGIGAVYGRKAILEDMPPWQGGGNMIADVTFERTLFQPPPNKFEAGTGNIADAVGLGAALEYVERWGIENIGRYEHELLEYATHHLRPIKGVRLIGTARDKASVLSFVLDGHTTEDVGKALNQEGIAVRTGHHCAQPILRRFGLETTVRPSLAFYNTCEEVDRFIAVIRHLARA
ncbi:MAG: family 2A encapsulin nanocompartment cargo protein cysteine desulfurase [Paracoccus sp. (in: a-proteobacteria)]|uniref:family 2A encapsulin nanocompartment cargo protein cysteine desulfurase n=1 Tax=Paracoccus sp. TaxID=267 RepID=UPI0039E4DD54